jgi:septum formation inhibitor-activating ATPase MinD
MKEYKMTGDSTLRLLLVSGGAHDVVAEHIKGKVDIVNEHRLMLDQAAFYLKETHPRIDTILITDEGLSNRDDQDPRELELLLQSLVRMFPSPVQVLFISVDFLKESIYGTLNHRYTSLHIVTCDLIRVPGALLRRALEDIRTESTQSGRFLSVQARRGGQEERTAPQQVESERKRSFFDRFRSKSQAKESVDATDLLTREFEGVSRSICRVIAVTGHRGSGITSTAVNIAHEAGKRGLRTILIDLDIDYRSLNMYSAGFHELTKRDEEMNASLLRMLARPQDYMTFAYQSKGQVWVTSLGYTFNDLMLMERFYNSAKLIGMLSLLRSHFNVILLDLPMDRMKDLKEALLHIDTFALCVPNNLPSVISLLRNVEVALDRENAAYVNAKSKLIVTRYNDRSRFQNEIFTPERVKELLASGLSDCFPYEIKLAGHVPYSSDFDSQVETDLPIVGSNAEQEKAFGNILLRLIEGAK